MNSESFIGAVAMFAGNFVPAGWLPCDGRTLLIAQHPALFSIIGARYGGDGRTNYCLPNFTGVFPTGMPLNQEAAKVRRQASASAQMPGVVPFGQANLPAHTHTAAFTGHKVTIDKAPVTLKASTASGANTPAK